MKCFAIIDGYIVGYQVVGEMIIPFLIKTTKEIFSYGVSQDDENSAYSIAFNFEGIERMIYC